MRAENRKSIFPIGYLPLFNREDYERSRNAEGIPSGLIMKITSHKKKCSLKKDIRFLM
jgi:hypothetical protein